MKNNKAILAALAIGLAFGSGVTYIMQSTKNGVGPTAGTSTTASTQGMAGMDMTGSTSTNSDLTMSQMMASLQGKSGDDFDRAFITAMIAHHEGAIDMANMALASAKHQEIRDMAEGIVTAQTSEIDQMKSWRAMWGY